jgi:hypothetical protein
MADAISSTTCHRHPERHGIARCMACQAVICQECATRFAGINYCVACLATTRAATTAQAGWAGRIALVLGLALTEPAAIAALGWTAALWARILP